MRHVLTILLLAAPALAQAAPFAIRAVDAATGRGVPLVELETTHHMLFVTDSAGYAAIDAPELLGTEVFFHVRSHGYEYPADGFGFRGRRVTVRRGDVVELELRRVNVAERLYRVTGGGIYADSVKLGLEAPIRQPLRNGLVFGQDSVVNALYRGRLFWFWGDTNRPGYPLGNFSVSGAVSALPADGGLLPDRGVDLEYFVGADGFARKMLELDEPGMVWIFGPMVVPHEGRERLLVHYARMKSLGERLEHGIATFDDDGERFVKTVEFPPDTRLHPSGNPVEAGGWFYFPSPYPAVRVRARYEDIVDPQSYEAFGYHDGQWRWQRGAKPWTARRPQRLPRGVRTWMGLTDVETGRAITGHGGTVHYNAHRGRWVMIALESGGRSVLGEVWFAEADSLMGPWGFARRIVTHDDYSFYNVKQHPYFAEDGGRRIYFEGTYTAMFSAAKSKTPRYEYNQVMYRLDLDDERLALPVPVHEVDGEAGLLTGPEVAERGLWSKVRHTPFWARPGEPPHLLPAAPAATGTIPIYRWSGPGDRTLLRDRRDSPGPGWQRGERPAGRAWRSPTTRPPMIATPR